MRQKDIELTSRQRENLESTWFVYGNGGPKHSMRNHRFIQSFLERGHDRRDFFYPSDECITVVDAILDMDDDSPLTLDEIVKIWETK